MKDCMMASAMVVEMVSVMVVLTVELVNYLASMSVEQMDEMTVEL